MRSLTEKSIISSYVREVLQEELVTVYRGGKQYTYDATFDETGNATLKKVDVTSDEVTIVNNVAKICNVPMSVLLDKLRQLKAAGVSRKAGSKENVVNVMNAFFEDTINEWEPKSRIGRGEPQLRLAFDVKDSPKEPDFISADDRVTLSVKYFSDKSPGQPSGTAKSGEANKTVIKCTNEIAKLLNLGNEGFIPDYWSSKYLRSAIQDKLNTESANLTAGQIKEVKGILLGELAIQFNEIKKSLLIEHEAQSILAIDSIGGFYLIGDIGKLSLTAIRNSGTRVEFAGPNVPAGISTFEKVLSDLRKSDSK